MSAVEMGGRVEYSFMAVAVKIVRTQDAENALGSLAIYKQSAKNTFFCIDIMRQISLAQLNHLYSPQGLFPAGADSAPGCQARGPLRPFLIHQY